VYHSINNDVPCPVLSPLICVNNSVHGTSPIHSTLALRLSKLCYNPGVAYSNSCEYLPLLDVHLDSGMEVYYFEIRRSYQWWMAKMSVVFACIAPHGAEAIPELAGDMLEAFAETRRGMEQLAAEMKQDKPDTIVLATPHNLRLEGTIGVVTTEFTGGTLEANNNTVKLPLQMRSTTSQANLGKRKKARTSCCGS